MRGALHLILSAAAIAGVAACAPGGKGLALEMPTREAGPDFARGKRVWASWAPDQGFFL